MHDGEVGAARQEKQEARPGAPPKNLRVGTSGWGYPEWVGPFYPEGLPRERWLAYYASAFSTNEVNTTFYHLPRRSTVESWARRTPRRFTFSLKLPKALTHEAKLDAGEAPRLLDQFLKVTSPLVESGKCVAHLLQLPPSFEKDEHWGRLDAFLKAWRELVDASSPPGQAPALAVEFRNLSWVNDETFDLLREGGACYVVVVEPLLPPVTPVTGRDAYVRFHGFGKNPWFNYEFSSEELDDWVPKIRALAGVVESGGGSVNVYFNNHFSGYAVKNALQLLGKFGAPIGKAFPPRARRRTKSLSAFLKKGGEGGRNGGE
ncbi:MAG: DUF72 domain-containing protein [Promethearchaeota archaeon]